MDAPLVRTACVFAGGIALGALASAICSTQHAPPAPAPHPPRPPVSPLLRCELNAAALIGCTPLVRIASLSEATGCEIMAKCEFMNPNGSVKDRVARSIISQAEASGQLRPGSTIVEATAGSTGIALAMQGAARGYAVELYLPQGVASSEKIEMLRTLGAVPHVVPIVPLNDPANFMHRAARRCLTDKTCFYADQFNNQANWEAHYAGTGAELWAQTGGRIDGFVCAAGTGGTLGGVSTYLKERRGSIRCALIDPPGSGIAAFLRDGTMYHRDDHMLVQPLEPRTVMEGVGLNRQTRLIQQLAGVVDDVFHGSDQEAVDMAHHLLRSDGLWVGGSGALNCVGAVRLARSLGPGHVIATILCDSGSRYTSKLYSTAWLAEHALSPRPIDALRSLCD